MRQSTRSSAASSARRGAGFAASAQGGKTNPGLLTIQFKAGDMPGLYQPTLERIGGNSCRYTIEVVAP